jgi:hypothetical protein
MDLEGCQAQHSLHVRLGPGPHIFVSGWASVRLKSHASCRANEPRAF